MSVDRLRKAVARANESAGIQSRGPHVQVNPPVDEAGLLALEASLGARLPRELVDWLSIHNGEAGVVGLLGMGVHLMTAQEIASAYLLAIGDEGVDEEDEFTCARGPVYAMRANKRWFPFANVNGEMACLDYDPAPGGKEGQVIFVDSASSQNRVMFASLAEMFESVGGG